MADPEKTEGMGAFASFVFLVGAGMLLVAALSSVNTAFHLGWVLRVGGARTALPDHWDAVVGVAAIGAGLVGLTVFGSYVRARFDRAKGKPAARLVILGAAALLVLGVGWGLRRWALLGTYHTMLAYYATDGDLADVRSEIDHGATLEELEQAAHRASQYDNTPAFRLLLEGARRAGNAVPVACAASGSNTVAFMQAAVEFGASPTRCPQPNDALSGALAMDRFDKRRHEKSDEEIAQMITLLRKAGWRERPESRGSGESLEARAERMHLPRALAALRAP